MVYQIKQLNGSNYQLAIDLLCEAMSDNPLHIAVFGADSKKRQSRLQVFFRLLLPFVLANGFLYGVFKPDKLVGVLGLIKPGFCNLSFKNRLKFGLNIFKSLNPIISTKVLYWLFMWHTHDLKIPHWHLGPLAVANEFRHQGIATMLLEYFFDMVQNDQLPQWLETDKQFNVDFYSRRGFKIKKTIKILQTKSWLMIKD